MSAPLTLHGVNPADLFDDVYFRGDYLSLHAGESGVESTATPRFRHGAAVRPIPGTWRSDLETPWGYGGPVATGAEALMAGLAEWRRRQREAGRVAEFMRLHPFANPAALNDSLDMLAFNRPTVIVDLETPKTARWKFYSDSTRNCLRKAERNLTVRSLVPEEWTLFKALYEIGLGRNAATPDYYLDDAYFQILLAKPWCRAWIAEDGEGPVAVSCFLHTGTPICHYHLSGGNDRSRRTNALYLLLEEAFQYYSGKGCRLMHLGGGRTPASEDPLLAFKAKFSPLRAHFYVGGLIYDPVSYANLGGGQGRFLCAGPNSATMSPPSPPKKGGPVSIRAFAPECDFAIFFALRCDPNNISWTGFDAPPSWTGLRDWVDGEMESDRRRIFIVEHVGQAVGYLYAKHVDGCVETAIGIAADWAGGGIGRQALAQLTTQLAGDPEWPPPYSAWINPDNKASIITHEAAGYQLDRDTPPRELGGREQRCWVWRQARQPGKDRTE